MKKEIWTEIEIDASAEKIWQILTDFEKFPAWNPFVVKAEGVPKVGEILSIEVKVPDASMQKFTPEVLVADENTELRWVGNAPLGAFRGEHFYKIEGLGENKSKFIHGELFSGWLVRLIWILQGKKIEKGYVLMNKALKEKAENKR